MKHKISNIVQNWTVIISIIVSMVTIIIATSVMIPVVISDVNADVISFQPAVPNYWVIIKDDNCIHYFRREYIISISDNIKPELAEIHGKSNLTLMNGREFYFKQYTASDLIKMIDR